MGTTEDLKALYRAAVDGEVAVVKRLLAEGMDPNERKDGDLPLLHLVSGYDKTEVARILLEHGAEVDALGGNPKHTALQRAVHSASQGMVELLLEYGADPHAKCESGESAIDRAKRIGKNHLVAVFEAKSEDETPTGDDIFEAVRSGDVRTLKHLLSNGMSPDSRNAEGETLLHIAAVAYTEDAARILLEHGADPNAQSGGRTPLRLVSWAGHAGLVRLLLEHGARIDDPESLIAAAQRQGNDAVVEILRSHLE